MYKLFERTSFNCCKECAEHFGVEYGTKYVQDIPLNTSVLETTDPTQCDYHTDYTGRAKQKERLFQEWTGLTFLTESPQGWASV